VVLDEAWQGSVLWLEVNAHELQCE